MSALQTQTIVPVFAEWPFAGGQHPYYESVTRPRLETLAHVPRMSTWTIGALLNHAVSCLDPTMCYLTIGVWCGFTYLAGLIENSDQACFGVDNFCVTGLGGLGTGTAVADAFYAEFCRYQGPRHEFYEMDYATYLTTVHRMPIGLYFYDGDHTYEHQLRGLQLAEPYFATGCVILIDDTNLPDVRAAMREFIKMSPHRYQTICDETTNTGNHPVYWNGLTAWKKIE